MVLDAWLTEEHGSLCLHLYFDFDFDFDLPCAKGHSECHYKKATIFLLKSQQINKTKNKIKKQKEYKKTNKEAKKSINNKQIN